MILKKPASNNSQTDSASRMIGITLFSAGFLLLALVLAMHICLSSLSNARESYWQQQSARLQSRGAAMGSCLTALDNYAQQLHASSALQKLAAMDGESPDSELVTAANEVTQLLSTHAYSLLHMPVKESHVYLANSGYIISSSHFTGSEQYYHASRGFAKDKYEQFLSLLRSTDRQGMWRSMSEFTGDPDSLFYMFPIASGPQASPSAVIWFEMDAAALRNLLLPAELQHDAAVLLLDQQGEPLLTLGSRNEALIAAMHGASFNQLGMARFGEWQLLRQTDPASLACIAAIPQRVCNEAVGSSSTWMLLLLLAALLLDIAMIIVLVRRVMHPYQRLSRKLMQTEDSMEQLQREMDAQRPLLNVAYVRKLLSGHVSSQDEAEYIMAYLGLQGGHKHYYVLHCIAHQQSAVTDSQALLHERIGGMIRKYMPAQYPAYYYPTPDQSYVVLVTYDDDQHESLNDLQQRVVKLHDALADECGLWFYAGVSERCTQASRLWESCEQSRTASRYTARHHVFLPYEFIRKDTDGWYYPIELSAKFLHFITSGNHDQVSDFLELIHRKNVEERNLPVPLLNLLLSDLRNTLFKARFQVSKPATEEALVRLRQLDERLYEAPTFSSLETNALTLCDFFVKFSTPNDPIADIEAYLQSSYTDPSLCLTKLSERFNISESYLSHLFKTRTGINLSVYLERLRMEEAARRLQHSLCDLSTLYADLGYSNAATFRRAFKKYHGVTPSEMRGKGS